jgi:hypothetical protein|tara:strand:+ start:512 stop:640 length:129 start_codon:yes stop_codon:yes gene_type:complete
MKKLKFIAIVLGMMLIAGAAAYFDYYVWCQKHPNAPFWTYLF